MLLKSFYDLRFGVSPGAARKDSHYLCNSIDEVTRVLDSEFEDSINVWLLFDYGPSTELVLDVYQHGELAQAIDLHPFVTIRVEGYPDITFHGPGEPTGYGVGSEDPEQVRMRLADGIGTPEFDGKIDVIVDWDSIRVPPLKGEIADIGDYVKLGESPLDDLDDLAGVDEDELEDELIERGWVDYGYHDFDA